ncbi:hypothetical protein L2C91_00220 [Rosenbergiella epipactidis]|uniref:hypothetical protein n=1 Tax=Rosenbergiella epipactidis TaxID=1544694 RepID=UPI002026D97B|nr:hypothetical protein [Rosenbergiella epipactidis]MCL9666827.1 hypothetical protein [Rosenbergiella epipactidis]
MRRYTYLFVGLLLTACSTAPPPPHRSTAACLAYQQMMTAPLHPYQHEQLRQQCERSRAEPSAP